MPTPNSIAFVFKSKGSGNALLRSRILAGWIPARDIHDFFAHYKNGQLNDREALS
ncbi:hypothetical protein HRH25_19220 [Flavisolibacter sp. BT320]|nr:hypothetical protein [Flavisolibacter longurius]